MSARLFANLRDRKASVAGAAQRISPAYKLVDEKAGAELAASCTVTDTPNPRIGNWIDISIQGPTREAVESAVADYRARHAGCEPKPAFYFIQNHGDHFGVGGSRGRDPRR